MSNLNTESTDNVEKYAQEMVNEVKAKYPTLYRSLFNQVTMSTKGSTRSTIFYSHGNMMQHIVAENNNPTIVSLSLFNMTPNNLMGLLAGIVMKENAIQGEYENILSTGTYYDFEADCPLLYGITPKPTDSRFINNGDGSYSFYFFGVMYTYVPIAADITFSNVAPMALKKHGWGILDHLFIGYGGAQTKNIAGNVIYEDTLVPNFKNIVQVGLVEEDVHADTYKVPVEEFLLPAFCEYPGYMTVLKDGKAKRFICKCAEKGDSALVEDVDDPTFVAVKFAGLNLCQSMIFYNHWLLYGNNVGPGVRRNSDYGTLVAFVGNRFKVPEGVVKVEVEGGKFILGSIAKPTVQQDNYSSPVESSDVFSLPLSKIQATEVALGDKHLTSYKVQDNDAQEIPLNFPILEIEDGILYRKGYSSYYGSIISTIFIVMGVPFDSLLYAELGWPDSKNRPKKIADYAHKIANVFGGCKIDASTRKFIYISGASKYLDRVWDASVACVEFGLMSVLDSFGMVSVLKSPYNESRLFSGIFSVSLNQTVPWLFDHWLVTVAWKKDDKETGRFMQKLRICRLSDYLNSRLDLDMILIVPADIEITKVLLRTELIGIVGGRQRSMWKRPVKFDFDFLQKDD